jgi:hypothetical protein
MLTHIKDARNVWTVIVKNKSYQFDTSNKNYDKLVELVKTGDGEGFVTLLDTGRTITKWSEGKFEVREGVLMYDGESVANVISDRILEMIEQGFDYKPMLRFVENLYSNVSMRSVNELYKFLEHKHLPITSDGCFIAYKGVMRYNSSSIKDKMGNDLVEGDLVDKHTGKSFRNNVGDVNQIARRLVDDDANVGCSYGLHVGSLNYATSYAGSCCPVVLCKVNPSDVVSVPHDCECQKVRVTKYEVVGMYEMPLDKAVESSYDDYEDDEDDEDYDDYEEDYVNDGW